MRFRGWLVLAGCAGVLSILLLALGGGQAQPRPAVLLNDQNTSGGLVLVDAARLPQGGFVAIHGVTDQGRPGVFWGVSGALRVGYHAEIPVPLDRNLTEETELAAVLYEDSNGNRVFDGPGSREHDPRYERSGRAVYDTATVRPTGAASPSSQLGTGAVLSIGAASAASGLAVWALWFREP